jgi:hypothetical protein
VYFIIAAQGESCKQGKTFSHHALQLENECTAEGNHETIHLSLFSFVSLHFLPLHRFRMRNRLHPSRQFQAGDLNSAGHGPEADGNRNGIRQNLWLRELMRDADVMAEGTVLDTLLALSNSGNPLRIERVHGQNMLNMNLSRL